MIRFLRQIILIFFGIFISLNGVLLAQDDVNDAVAFTDIRAYYEFSPETALIGETVTLTFTLESPVQVETIENDMVADDNTPFMLIDEGEWVEEQDERGYHYTKDYQVIAWETGTWLTPELMVNYQANGQVSTSMIQSGTLFVEAIITGDELAIFPEFPNRDIAFTPRWVIVASGVVIASILVGIWWLVTRPRGDGVIVQNSPAQRAIEDLYGYSQQGLDAIVLYGLVANRLRVYIGERFDVEIGDRTTSEIALYLQDEIALSPALVRKLNRILEQADLVKFAQFEPDDETKVQFLKYSVRWVRACEIEIREMQKEDDA